MLKALNNVTGFSRRKVFSWLRKNKYSLVRPGIVSARRDVPGHILLPPYITDGRVDSTDKAIVIKTDEEIDKMRDVCQLARRILNETAKFIRPGITTDELDRIVHELTLSHNAYPSPLAYQGFPKSCCTSVNNVALHGIPDDRVLERGDIINLDITIYKYGFHGDLSETYAVGDVDPSATRLIAATKQALQSAVSICGPGVELSRIGRAIEASLDGSGCAAIPQICGHGIGRVFHEPPDIVHVDYECGGEELRPGMVFTIEPCVSEGGTGIRLLQDGWTYVSADNSRSAQFEHTIAVTEHGCEVLTRDG